MKVCAECKAVFVETRPSRYQERRCWECVKKKYRDWYAAHKDDEDYKKRITASSKRNYSENKVRLRELKYKHPSHALFVAAKYRAKLRDLPFNMTEDDIPIPDTCPLLGIPIFRAERRTDNSPSVDRLLPELGYISGNVWVISWRANKLKNNATLQELEMLATNLRKKLAASTSKQET